MTTAAVICEYNPFHNGHAYHIRKTRESAGADFIIALMSGNYVQRGTPAIVDKQIRTQAALLGGADLVVELPLWTATGSAPYFAAGSIALLNQLGIVDVLSFGSECSDLGLLTQIASFFVEFDEIIHKKTAEYNRLGYSYPKAKEMALTSLIPNDSWIKVIREPNNILGLEYMKALILSESSIRPFCIGRETSRHHETSLHDSISSASAIRNAITEHGISEILSQVPKELHSLYLEHYAKDFPVTADDFSLLLHSALCRTPDYTDFWGISKDFSDRLCRVWSADVSFTKLIEQCKTKNMTWSRISRNLLHIMLEMTAKQHQSLSSMDMVPYFQILGFRKSASHLIAKLKEHVTVPMVRHLRKLDDPLTPQQEILLNTERHADQLYRLVLGNKFHISKKDRQIIV